MAAPLITAWSYSRYSLYEQCPLKFRLKHIDKLPDPSGPAAERGNMVHSAAQKYLQSKRTPSDIPEALAKLSVELGQLRVARATAEQDWGFKSNWEWTGRPNWFGSEVWVRMRSDATALYEDNTGLMVDWKTGKKYDTHQVQGELSGLLMLMRYPELTEVDVRFWYSDAPAADNEMQLDVTRADVPAMQRDWERKVRPMFNDHKFPPKPNRFCGWCNYSAAKGGPCKF